MDNNEKYVNNFNHQNATNNCCCDDTANDNDLPRAWANRAQVTSPDCCSVGGTEIVDKAKVSNIRNKVFFWKTVEF